MQFTEKAALALAELNAAVGDDVDEELGFLSAPASLPPDDKASVTPQVAADTSYDTTADGPEGYGEFGFSEPNADAEDLYSEVPSQRLVVTQVGFAPLYGDRSDSNAASTNSSVHGISHLTPVRVSSSRRGRGQSYENHELRKTPPLPERPLPNSEISPDPNAAAEASSECDPAAGDPDSDDDDDEPTYESPLNIGIREVDTSDMYEWARGRDPLCGDEEQPVWLHAPTMTRPYAEKILMRNGAGNGLFVLRAREEPQYPWCLSVCIDKHIEHHLIKKNDDSYEMEGARRFPAVEEAPNLNLLISHLAFTTDYVWLNAALYVPRRSQEQEGNMPEWFHHHASRADAVRRLSGHTMPLGRFLVRPSTAPGCYALSVVKDNKVYHHLLRFSAGTWSVNDNLLKGCVSLVQCIEALRQPRDDFSPALTTFVRPPPPFQRLLLPRLPPNSKPPIQDEDPYLDPNNIFYSPDDLLTSADGELVQEVEGAPPTLHSPVRRDSGDVPLPTQFEAPQSHN